MTADILNIQGICRLSGAAHDGSSSTGRLPHGHTDPHNPVRGMGNMGTGDASSRRNQIDAAERTHGREGNIIGNGTAGSFFIVLGLAGACRIVDVKAEMCLMHHGIGIGSSGKKVFLGQ